MHADAQRWVDFAQSDLQMAGIAFEHRYGHQCIFHLQQAIEKLLKAIWVDRADMGMPPRTHELPRLVRNLGLEISETDARFLQTLSEQYLPSHYADFDVEYPDEAVAFYFERTTAIYQWLHQQLS